MPESADLQEFYIHEPYIRQLNEYFGGKRRSFVIPLDISGTTFQKEVWQAVMEIPYGEVMTYGEIARKLGPNANPRNVGQANAQNPLGILIPCHRVVGEDFKLAGYAWGIDRKRQLLELEGAIKQQELF